mmetsp:Transcript_16626/g.20153  ORF Transcript_16626/g.20153 Transcript_16626/m.20153 type:complete len:105 (-) Transcript_16626:208-522(-)
MNAHYLQGAFSSVKQEGSRGSRVWAAYPEVRTTVMNPHHVSYLQSLPSNEISCSLYLLPILDQPIDLHISAAQLKAVSCKDSPFAPHIPLRRRSNASSKWFNDT